MRYARYAAQATEKTLKPIPGDLNGDSELDTRDVVAEMKAVADGSTNQKYDINGDGDVDTKDLVNLVKKGSQRAERQVNRKHAASIRINIENTKRG